MRFLQIVSSLGYVLTIISGATVRHVVNNGQIISGQYIVSLRAPAGIAEENYSGYVQDHLRRVFGNNFQNNLLHLYNLGYAIKISTEDEAILDQLIRSDEVDVVERDQVVKADATQVNPPNWGLDRICRRDLPLQSRYDYSNFAGSGVDVYVVDTGININHVDFQGRAFWGKTIPVGDPDSDDNGHGTHVASTIVGVTYGVAKRAKVYAVKVLRSSGYGSMSDVIAGVEWVVSEHKRKSSISRRRVRSIGNMSLGGGKSFALDSVVNSAFNNGVLFAVAAGNDNQDACNYSPAGAQNAVSVGATQSNDARSGFSNWGTCVDIFAPGSGITAAWIGSTTAIATLSGTSMASPHVAGVLALIHAEAIYTPAQLRQRLLSTASRGKVYDTQGAPNLLAFSGPVRNANEEADESSIVSRVLSGRTFLFNVQQL